jgi:hypothetical protein
MSTMQARTDALVNPSLGLPFPNMFQHAPQPVVPQHPGFAGVASAGGMAASPNLMQQTWRPLSSARDNAPCNTLFIGNLGENTREEELHQLMATQPGFR